MRLIVKDTALYRSFRMVICALLLAVLSIGALPVVMAQERGSRKIDTDQAIVNTQTSDSLAAHDERLKALESLKIAERLAKNETNQEQEIWLLKLVLGAVVTSVVKDLMILRAAKKSKDTLDN